MKKDFSVLKWFVFPALILCFGAGIAYNSYKIFGNEGSIAYYLILFGIFVISLVMVLHTSKHEKENGEKEILPSTKGAFAFECALMFALGVTLVCSVYVQRKLSGHREAAAADVQMVEAVGKLKSTRAQASLAKTIKPTADIAAAVELAETMMFWPLVGELGLALAGLMTVFGLVLFVNHKHSTGQSPGQSGGQSPGQSGGQSRGQASVQQPVPQAPLRVGGYSQFAQVTNGNGFFFTFSQSGNGQSLRFRERGSNAKHVAYVTLVDAERMAQLDYRSLALEAMQRRKAKHGEDAVYRQIAQSVV